MSLQSFMNKNSLYVFDFCETLVSLQTGDIFVEYVLRELNLRDKLFLYAIITSKGYYALQLLFPTLRKNKKHLLLKLLKGIKKSTLDKLGREYCLKLQSNFLIHPVLRELIDAKKSGCLVFILSAGYTPYIRHFMPDFVDKVIANEFEYKKDVFTGRIEGKDCIGEEKVIRLCSELNESDFLCAGYSDSPSDIPFLNLCESKIIVSKSKSQEWPLVLGFKEMIWD